MRGTAAETADRIGGRRAAGDAGRKRAAVELIARDGERLRRAARRYSLCAEDAEDAYQRGLEILLTKAPTEQPRELLAWTTTVIKHEALAVRRAREKVLCRVPVGAEKEHGDDWLARLPSPGPGPLERLEQREEIARSREAIRALKPAERQALALLAEGYSYREIGEITGFSATKVNRCLAEGRERLRQIVTSGEDGSRCAELRPLLSAFCDGEAGAGESDEVREHLRACGCCRATVRAYRAAPRTVAALCPLPLVLGAAAGAKSGGGLLSAAKSALAGFVKTAGMNKVLAACAVGGATACVATGVVPAPKSPGERPIAPRIEPIAMAVAAPARLRAKASSRRPERAVERAGAVPPQLREAKASSKRAKVSKRDDAVPPLSAPPPAEAPEPPVEAPQAAVEPVATEAAPAEAPVQTEPAPPPPPASGGAAGEFGP
ncbi:MAG TPA: sigma-70 family RNA polymerase sigma factor [Solirubrobacterales bacterium]|nr:sigma-70 family RNA polymerase sigma factor [Solirubrobacterales bacterium]